jgi:hypothetical protein
MNALSLVLAIALSAFAASAQEPQAKQPDTLRLVITTKVGGKPEPRLDRDGKETGARRWTGRVIEWTIGDKTLTKFVDAEKELFRIARDPVSLRESKAKPGQKEILPLVVEPDQGVCWCEILASFDLAMVAGFADWRLLGAGTRYFVPKSVDEPVIDGGAVIMTRAVFNEPDDLPHQDRHTFTVRQDGSIVHGGRVLFRWQAGKPDDLAALNKELLAIRATMEKGKHIGKRHPDGAAAIDVPVLVCADKWCEWRDVRRLMQCLFAPEVGFWKFEIGVSDVEQEPGDKEFGKRR